MKLYKHLLVCSLFFVTALTAGEKIIVGIAGGTGSGKSTLAQRIQEHFKDSSILISQDSYYKSLAGMTHEERAKVNFDHPDSLDFALLREHLVALKSDKAILKPIYNFQTHDRDPTEELVEPVDIIFVEGILLFAVPEIRELFDMKIFLDITDDVRLLRRMERDIRERGRDFKNVRDQYLATVKPMHDLFVEPSKKYADVLVPHGGENVMAISVIVSKLKEELKINTASTQLASKK